MQVQQILDRARLALNDDDKVRYGDPELLAYARESLPVVRRARPDAFLGRWQDTFETLDYGDDLPIADAFHQVVADYITGRAETKNADAAAESRAALFLKLSSAGA